MKTNDQIRLKLAIGIALSLLLLMRPDRSQAQWPLFNFRLTPVYEQGTLLITSDLLQRKLSLYIF
jgi:hypothetical protein